MLTEKQLFQKAFLHIVGTKIFNKIQIYALKKKLIINSVHLKAEVTNGSPLDFESLLRMSRIISMVGSSFFKSNKKLLSASG